VRLGGDAARRAAVGPQPMSLLATDFEAASDLFEQARDDQVGVATAHRHGNGGNKVIRSGATLSKMAGGHLAGITRDNLLFRMTDDDWDGVINTHLKGSFIAARSIQKYMVDQRSTRLTASSDNGSGGRTTVR
jgi:NAD(P)-dependent dehydrogenase (short-subunit alcohol dehydrogenase family)